jgi:1,4-dihydroxy-2-naphthoate octaprenyltransferase
METTQQGVPQGRQSLSYLWTNWKDTVLGCNLPAGRQMDRISKWLIMTRACVFSMTLTAGLIGGLLAVGSAGAGGVNWFYLILSVLGVTLAHASNNLINDYFDLAVGLDSSEDYVRAQYAPHPILSGMSSKREMLLAILLINLIDGGIMIYLTLMRGPLVLAFALSGLFISVFYTAPPIRLKQIGLGEIGVALVWGPLMTAGTYYVAAGSLPAWVLVASIPYALMVMTVLVGKHIDKIPQDREKGIRTLPVILGEKAAKRLNQVLFVAFYPVVFLLILSGDLSVWLLVVLLSVPMLIETLAIFNRPKPDEPPEGYTVWPLWFVSIAFRFTRLAGGTFLLGLILHIFFPVTINLF